MSDAATFAYEAEMTPHVEAVVSAFMPSGRTAHFVAKEVQGAVGVIDLVAAEFDAEIAEDRFNRGAWPVLHPHRVRVLSALPRRQPLRIDTIAHRVGARPAPLIRSTLRPLADLGLVEISSGRVLRTDLWNPVANALVAIELKLSKWRRALRQADNAALSADHAWVVVDRSSRGGAAGGRAHFASFGLGLALIDPAGALEILARPRRRRALGWYRAWLAELVWWQALEAQTNERQVSRKPASARSLRTSGSESRKAIASSSVRRT